MTLTGDVFNLYVFLEVASISCNTALVALGGRKPRLAASRRACWQERWVLPFPPDSHVGILQSDDRDMKNGRSTGRHSFRWPHLSSSDASRSVLPWQLAYPHVTSPFSLSISQPLRILLYPSRSFSTDLRAPSRAAPGFAIISLFLSFLFGIHHWIIDNTLADHRHPREPLRNHHSAPIHGAVPRRYFRRIAGLLQSIGHKLAISPSANRHRKLLLGVAGSYLHILNHILLPKAACSLVIGAIQYRFRNRGYQTVRTTS